MAGGSTEPEGPHDKECPACGLYYQDKGASFAMHQAACTGEASTEPTTSTETTEPTTEATTASEGATEGGGGNPLHDGPQPRSRGDGSKSGPDCPSCGGELVDYRRHHTDPHTEKPTPWDYLCSKCQKTWDDNEQ